MIPEVSHVYRILHTSQIDSRGVAPTSFIPFKQIIVYKFNIFGVKYLQGWHFELQGWIKYLQGWHFYLQDWVITLQG